MKNKSICHIRSWLEETSVEKMQRRMIFEEKKHNNNKHSIYGGNENGIRHKNKQ